MEYFVIEVLAQDFRELQISMTKTSPFFRGLFFPLRFGATPLMALKPSKPCFNVEAGRVLLSHRTSRVGAMVDTPLYLVETNLCTLEISCFAVSVRNYRVSRPHEPYDAVLSTTPAYRNRRNSPARAPMTHECSQELPSKFKDMHTRQQAQPNNEIKQSVSHASKQANKPLRPATTEKSGRVRKAIPIALAVYFSVSANPQPCRIRRSSPQPHKTDC